MILRWRTRTDQARHNLRENISAYLTAHFFKRFFTGEITSTENDLKLGIGGMLALLMLPGAVLSLLLLPKYSSLLHWLEGRRHFDFNIASIPDKYMLLTLTMVITGIVAVLKWDSLFPDRLDYANLVHLPLKTTSILFAKLLALALFVGLFVAALNAASTIFFPLVVLESETRGMLFVRFVIAHAVATLAGSVFAFCFFLALAGMLMTLLPYRWFRRISTAVQLISVISLATLLFSTPQIGSHLANTSGKALPTFQWLPSVWFLGLYETMMGAADPGFHALAARAGEALATALAASLLFYAACYWRHFRRIPETAEGPAGAPGRTKQFARRCFDRLALGRPFDRACVHFARKTLARSQRHALLLAGFVGLGVAIAVQDAATNWSQTPQGGLHLPNATLLSAALTVVFFLLSGLAFVFDLPAELSANWVFQAAGEYERTAGQRVARRILLIFLAPVIIATTSVYSALWGPRLGIMHAAFVLVASLLLIEILLVGYRKIPFACSYAPGKNNLGMVLAVYLLAFLSFANGLSYFEQRALASRNALWLPALMVLIIASAVALRQYESHSSSDQCKLVFKDEPEAVVASMDLR